MASLYFIKKCVFDDALLALLVKGRKNNPLAIETSIE